MLLVLLRLINCFSAARLRKMSFASLTQQLYKLLLQSKVNAKTIFITCKPEEANLKRKIRL
jgi:hypothetical protein